MSWPAPQDYNEAVQNPHLAFADADLMLGQPELTPLGLPRPISGNFACVYKMQTSNGTWAARCFMKEVPDLQERYKAISEYLAQGRLPYTVPFTYNPRGLRVQGRPFPLLKMQWVQGQSLNTFVEEVLGYPDTLLSTARFWAKMMGDLRAANVAHGDLQHGNVLVVGDQLRLVDYDGMFVPALAGKESNELGHRNYQLPSRTALDYGPYLDNFSAWVIYVSLIALAVHPEFWQAHGGGDECLLFRKADFEDPGASALLRDLLASPHAQLRLLVETFTAFFPLAPWEVPALDGNLPAIKIEPPKPWYVDHIEKRPQPIENSTEERIPAERDEPVFPDPGWIIDSLAENKAVEKVKFQDQPKELRIMAASSVALVVLLRFLVAAPLSEFLIVLSFVAGLNIVVCFITYKTDASRIEFARHKDKAKQFVRQIREHKALMASLHGQQLDLQRKLGKKERELEARLNHLSAKVGAQLAKLQAGFQARLLSVQRRRQRTIVEEAAKLQSLQATLQRQTFTLNQKIAELTQAEADEKDRLLSALQENYILNRLQGQFIASSSIFGIGPAYKGRLLEAGIVTAADIDARINRIHGIGPTRQAALFRWRKILEQEARRTAPVLSYSDALAIEAKYRPERQAYQAGKQQLQSAMEDQAESARQYFAAVRQSLDEEEQQIRFAAEQEENQRQQEYSSRAGELEAEGQKVKEEVTPALDELSKKLRDAQAQVFSLRWKSEKHHQEGRRYASLSFRNYLREIVSG